MSGPVQNKMLSGLEPLVTITGDLTITTLHGGNTILANPGGGTIKITLPTAFTNGFHLRVMKISSGTVYFEAGASATIYNTDTAIVNLYETIDVWNGIGTSNEWVLQGTLEPAPGALPTELTYYWSIESVSLSGSDVDSWIEQKAAVGDDWSQTGSNRPTIVTNGGPGGTVDAIAFNGTDQFFPRFVLSGSVSQAFFVTICMDELEGGSSEGYIFDDTPAASFMMMRMNFSEINCYSGGGGSFDVVPFGTLPAGWYVLTVHFDGTNTAALLDGGSWSSPIASGGSNAINGISFGERSDGTLRGAMRVTDFGIGAGTQTDAAVVHDYVRALRGFI